MICSYFLVASSNSWTHHPWSICYYICTSQGVTLECPLNACFFLDITFFHRNNFQIPMCFNSTIFVLMRGEYWLSWRISLKCVWLIFFFCDLCILHYAFNIETKWPIMKARVIVFLFDPIRSRCQSPKVHQNVRGQWYCG